MKKRVIIARIIFWIAFFVFMASLSVREVILRKNAIQFANDVTSMLNPVNSNIPAKASLDFKPALIFILWGSGFFMFISFVLIESATIPKPKIKKGSAYKLTAVIPHTKGKTLVLTYGDRVENFWCGDILAPEKPKIGNKYAITKVGDDILLTPA